MDATPNLDPNRAALSSSAVEGATAAMPGRDQGTFGMASAQRAARRWPAAGLGVRTARRQSVRVAALSRRRLPNARGACALR